VLNNIVDKVYCINLKNRPKRLERSMQIFDEWSIDYSVWRGICGVTDSVCLKMFNDNKVRFVNSGIRTEGSLGIYFTIINLIKHAKKNRYKRICIFEDDFLLSNNFNKDIESIGNLIESFHMIYLGASQHDRGSLERLNNKFYYAKKTQGLFGVIISSSVFDRIVNLENNIYTAIDNAISKDIHRFRKSYVFLDNIVIADTSYSDTRKDFRDLKNHSIKMKWDLKKFSKSLMVRGIT